MKHTLICLIAGLFVAASFLPSVYEWSISDSLPPERQFFLEHNYLYDYNFYLSRIREGQEGRWLVTEKYYNQPHQASLFQIMYLYMGKIGSWVGMSVPVVYHTARIVWGWLLLVLVGLFVTTVIPGQWGLIGYGIALTAGSWPIIGSGWRLGTYMGWWSVIDSLQRITTLPHVVAGQFFLVLFLWRFNDYTSPHPSPFRRGRIFLWGIIGLISGIIFPPTLIVVYAVFLVQSGLELILTDAGRTTKTARTWLKTTILSRGVFLLLSAPALLYAQWMFWAMPWQSLALFDIQHRINLPYDQYAGALGPVLPLGIAGLLVAVARKEKKQLLFVSWILAIGMLFLIFEQVPTQSPLRFTEAMLQVPLSILTTYLLAGIWRWSTNHSVRMVLRGAVLVSLVGLLGMGIAVMWSMELWKMDEAVAKGKGTWPVPLGNQLAYPLKDFMAGVYYLRDHAPKDAVVLSYITAGNYIPAYAGQYVYIGHANTPDEDKKEPIAASFFSGKMTQEEAQSFVRREHISFVFFGPQERALAAGKSVAEEYPFLERVFTNSQVTLYRVR